MTEREYMTEADKLGEAREKTKALPDWELKEIAVRLNEIYGRGDATVLENFDPKPDPLTRLETMEELIARDAQRVQDGYPKKLIIKRIPSPRGGVITVPTAEEEKLYHGAFDPAEGGGNSTSGQGEGEEGDVLGEQPIDGEGGEGEDEGAGEDDGGEHDAGQDAYNLGRELMKDMELPNLKDKGKKVRTKEYTYDLTDRFRGAGQIVDKGPTLRRIIRTNQALGRIDPTNPDPSRFIIGRHDIVYRILSREQVEKSMAVVFFVRDYSGSMSGAPTDVVVHQHVLIYSWLLFQYDKLVIPRFILHDTDAKEVPDFYTYYNSKVAGGTKIASAYKFVNKIIEDENLARDYNIYLFQGTDGDDWDEKGEEAIPELNRLIDLPINRIGITVARHANNATTHEKYMDGSGLLEKKDFIRLAYVNASEAAKSEEINLDCIKSLIS